MVICVRNQQKEWNGVTKCASELMELLMNLWK